MSWFRRRLSDAQLRALQQQASLALDAHLHRDGTLGWTHPDASVSVTLTTSGAHYLYTRSNPLPTTPHEDDVDVAVACAGLEAAVAVTDTTVFIEVEPALRTVEDVDGFKRKCGVVVQSLQVTS